jgi:hypothetical protein
MYATCGVGLYVRYESSTLRAAAMRSFCIQHLGLSLFDRLHTYMREQCEEKGDDKKMSRDLLDRIGHRRVQFIALVDRLLYEEEQSLQEGRQ